MISRLDRTHLGGSRTSGRWGNGWEVKIGLLGTPPPNMAGSGTQTCLTEVAARVERLVLPVRVYLGHLLPGSLINSWGSASISKQTGTAPSSLPSRVTPRGRKAHWEVPEKETGCLGSATFSYLILEEVFSLLSLCLLTCQVGGIFRFAGFLGGFRQNHQTTFTFLTSPLGTFLFANSTPARCLFQSPGLCFCSSLHLRLVGLACFLQLRCSSNEPLLRLRGLQRSLLSRTL